MVFQGHIHDVLREHLDQLCKVYIDDIIVDSNLLEEHRQHVRLILTKLQEVFHYLKFSKCEFQMQQISFVMFIVTPEGVEMKQDRVHTIAEWLEPTCYSNIQVFLDFANFYSCFSSSFSCIVKPMTNMLIGRGRMAVLRGRSYPLW